jgi:hypothetical protein
MVLMPRYRDLCVLTLMLGALKAANQIDLPWWVVTAPAWAPLAVIIGGVALFAAFVGIIRILE